MQLNVDRNYGQPKAAQPSFGQWKLASGGEYALRQVLSNKEWIEFSEIVNKYRDVTSVDTYLFGYGEKLSARLVSKARDKGLQEIKNYDQHFWQSPMKFIRKIAEKTDQWIDERKNIPDVNVDEIIKGMR